MPSSQGPAEETPALSAAEHALGGEFVAALADRDSQRLESCLRPDVRLRALLPSGPEEQRSSVVVVRRFLSWFEDAENVHVVEKSERAIVDRLHLHYRFRELYADGTSDLIEQDLLCDLEGDRIAAIDLLCSGHLPESSGPGTGVRRLDAGELGCGSGLPQEFRRQLQALPPGGTLEVSTRDSSAKEDLPSLARLLGHRVVSVSETADGSTVIAVQRGR